MDPQMEQPRHSWCTCTFTSFAAFHFFWSGSR